MSETLARPDFLLETRGHARDLGEWVQGVAWDGDVAGFALVDGQVHLASGDDWRGVAAHDGGVLAIAPHPAGGLVTAGEDGALQRLAAAGELSRVRKFGSRWVEQLAVWGEGRSGLIAASVGKAVHVLDASGAVLKTLEHPSTVTGIAFDGRGKRIGASHYNGATLWFVAAKVDSPRRLEWKGSHTGIAIHPGGEAVVTAMQENALHGWRLSDTQHMRMSGYPTKSESLSFTRNGRWLASSGADVVVLWPFHGGGPMGKAPMELAGGDEVICSRVACHPKHEAVAAGFRDGLVVLADIGSSRILPVAGPGHGAVSALAWNASGSHLAFGTESGFAAVVDFSKRDA